jgi:hypothetical protein
MDWEGFIAQHHRCDDVLHKGAMSWTYRNGMTPLTPHHAFPSASPFS